MNKVTMLLVLAALALPPAALAQNNNHNKKPMRQEDPHQGDASHSMKMGMSGMEALQKRSGKEFNIAFLSQMIAHHKAAVRMAQNALHTASHAETKKEARKVIADQNKEIKQMTVWLQKWYGVKPSQSQMKLANTDMKAMMAMNITTDQMFFEMMMPHHQGAIEMSQLALQRTDRPEVKKLAQNIIKAQKAEIARYKTLLHHVQ